MMTGLGIVCGPVVARGYLCGTMRRSQGRRVNLSPQCKVKNRLCRKSCSVTPLLQSDVEKSCGADSNNDPS
jgi:hypothetical protein